MSFLMRCRPRVVSALCLMSLMGQLGGAWAAEPPARSPRSPDPLDPQATVPPARHRPVVPVATQPAEVAVGDWVRANTTVERIGGWRAYAREAAAPAAAASAPGAPR